MEVFDQISLGDIWMLQLMQGAVVVGLLGMIYGHQR